MSRAAKLLVGGLVALLVGFGSLTVYQLVGGERPTWRRSTDGPAGAEVGRERAGALGLEPRRPREGPSPDVPGQLAEWGRRTATIDADAGAVADLPAPTPLNAETWAPEQHAPVPTVAPPPHARAPGPAAPPSLPEPGPATAGKHDLGGGAGVVLIGGGAITLTGKDRWGAPLDTVYQSADYLRNALPVLKRSLAPQQAQRLEAWLRATGEAEPSGAPGSPAPAAPAEP